jgi:biotin operon repressor
MYIISKSDKSIAYMKDCVLHSLPHEPIGIHQKDISNNTGFSTRDVRHIIQRLRDDGYAICGTPNDGYWIAQTSFELNDTIAKMRSHIEQSTDTLDALIEAQKRLEIKEGLR